MKKLRTLAVRTITETGALFLAFRRRRQIEQARRQRRSRFLFSLFHRIGTPLILLAIALAGCRPIKEESQQSNLVQVTLTVPSESITDRIHKLSRDLDDLVIDWLLEKGGPREIGNPSAEIIP